MTNIAILIVFYSYLGAERYACVARMSEYTYDMDAPPQFFCCKKFCA